MYYLIIDRNKVDCFSYDKSIIESTQEIRGGEVVFSSLPLSEVLNNYSQVRT